VPDRDFETLEAGIDRTLLEIRDVALRFGGIVALDGVSFTIEEGQILGLIGPNGAGKTTLFNCVSRLYSPNRGEILLDGPRCSAGRRTASPRSASAVPSRTWRCSRRNRCSTMSGSAPMRAAGAISSAIRCACRGCAARRK